MQDEVRVILAHGSDISYHIQVINDDSITGADSYLVMVKGKLATSREDSGYDPEKAGILSWPKLQLMIKEKSGY